MRFTPHEYQVRSINWIKAHPYCALLLDMGLGKSVITLTAIVDLMDSFEVERVLIVAPKKVAETTWTAEVEKWDHTKWLTVSKVMGNATRREKALAADADIYVIGRDSFKWLCDYYKYSLPFDMVVLDELTSFKSHSSQRFKAMRKARPSFARIVGLTGTPAPNGLLDLWAQMACIDGGERLGPFFTRYRETYFREIRWNNIVIKAPVKKGCDKIIQDKVADICLSLQAKDYLTLPDMMVHDRMVELPPKVRTEYDLFERDSVLDLMDTEGDDKVVAGSAAALMNKLSQFSNGCVYDSEGVAHPVHSEKLEALSELVEAAQSPVLVFYQYRSDIPRIRETLKGMKVVEYTDGDTLSDWNAGRIDVLLAHPASTAYGLNMQAGGHYIVWFGTGWNLELYQQANARLHRQGQSETVHVYRLVCEGTVDEKAVAALDSKKSVQQALMDNLDALLKKYNKKTKQGDPVDLLMYENV